MEKLIVFDMDGVLAEVSESYREGIVQTVEHFTGRKPTREMIQSYKNAGGWNNDWALSQKICSDFGVEIPYQTVVDHFNEIFIGNDGDGLILRESWIPKSGFLQHLASRYGLSVFTGRVQYEAELTLRRFTPGFKFDPLLCADHIERAKPAPDGLLEIQRRKPNMKLIYIGDTVDDARSARAASVPFIGIAAANHLSRPEILRLFEQENAVGVVENVNEIEPLVEAV